MRTLQAAAARLADDPAAAVDLLPVLLDEVVTDRDLTLGVLFGWIDALDHRFDAVVGEQLPATPYVVAGNSVLLPALDDPQAIDILARFAGHTPAGRTTLPPIGDPTPEAGAAEPTAGEPAPLNCA